jgi:hypothetical protein
VRRQPPPVAPQPAPPAVTGKPLPVSASESGKLSPSVPPSAAPAGPDAKARG